MASFVTGIEASSSIPKEEYRYATRRQAALPAAARKCKDGRSRRDKGWRSEGRRQGWSRASQGQTRFFVDSVERFHSERAEHRGARGAAKTGAVTVVQRTSSDLRLNPHLHIVDYADDGHHQYPVPHFQHRRCRGTSQAESSAEGPKPRVAP
jgi:hypothetical protein